MQLIQTSRDQLLRPLQTVSGIVERRHTLPILANLLIRKKGAHVSFLSTDVEIQITTHAEFGVGNDDVATTVAARKLLDILRAMPEGEVKLELVDKRLTVKSGRSRFALQTLAADEFPTVAEAASYSVRTELPQKSLKHLLAMVHFAMAQQDIRYYLNGMLLVIEGSKVIAVATDGHRLAYCSVDTGNAVEGRHEVIIPRKTVLELQRLLEDLDDPVEVSVAQNQIKFRFGSVELLSKLVEGRFPDFQRVIPKGYSNQFIASRALLQASLQRAAILTNEKFKGVRWSLDTNVLKINSTNTDQEEAQEEIELDYHGDAIDIGFNVSYLLDVLGNLKVENLQIAMGDSNASALITLPDDDSFKYVVMPMRI